MNKVEYKIRRRLNSLEAEIKELKNICSLDALSSHGRSFVEGKIFAYREEIKALRELLELTKNY